MVEKVENITEYHDVVANALSNIVRLRVEKNMDKELRQLAILCIRQAYVLYVMDDVDERGLLNTELDNRNKNKKDEDKIDLDTLIEERLEKMKLDDMDANKLLTKMFVYQSKAGIKPVQTHTQHARVFEVHRSELYQ